MARRNESKINQLFQHWPHGTVAVHPWLETQGIYRQLADTYRKGAWIVPIGRGAFRRADDKVEWPGGVYAIQQQLGLNLHVGGKAALALHGAAHFIPMKKQTVWLFGRRGERIPAWFLRHDWGVNLKVSAMELFKPDDGLGLESKKIGNFSITVASRERAMLEVVNFVPLKQALEEAASLMDGLTTLRPELVQQLLERCRSIKAKRVFLYLAETCGHPWFKRLKINKVDLGTGNREIVKGGRLDVKYHITVPQESKDDE